MMFPNPPISINNLQNHIRQLSHTLPNQLILRRRHPPTPLPSLHINNLTPHPKHTYQQQLLYVNSKSLLNLTSKELIKPRILQNKVVVPSPTFFCCVNPPIFEERDLYNSMFH